MLSRLTKGIGANAVGQAINIASRFVLLPLFLKSWGAEVYGEWLVLSSMVAYLSLTDFGGQVYIVNRLTQAYAKGDLAEFRQILHSGMALFLVAPLVAFFVFLLLLASVPLPRLLNITNLPQTVTYIVATLLALQFLVALPQGILLGVYRSIGRLPFGVMLANLMALMQLVLTTLALVAKQGAVVVALLQIVPFGVIAWIALHDLGKRYPELQASSLESADFSLARSLIHPSFWFFNIQLSQLVSIQGTVLIAGAILGPVQVVLFTALRTIANAARQLLSLVTHTAWPEITRLDTEGDIDKLRTLFSATLRTTLVGAAGIFVIFHVWGEDLFRLWLGGSVEYRHHLMDMILVYVLQAVFWTASSHVLMATNVHKTLSKVTITASVVGLLFAFIGASRYGLEGMVGGMILSELLLPFWVVPWLLWRLHSCFDNKFYIAEIFPVAFSVGITFLLPAFWFIWLILLGMWWGKSIRGLMKRKQLTTMNS